MGTFFAVSGSYKIMRRTLVAIASLAIVAVSCKGEASAPTDPKSLYRMEAAATPVKAGEKGTVRIAVVPKEGAEVKAETPFRGKLTTSGPVELEKTELKYADHVRVEKKGPVFEIPFQAQGDGAVQADLTFFVCVAEACLRTTEKLDLPVRVR